MINDCIKIKIKMFLGTKTMIFTWFKHHLGMQKGFVFLMFQALPARGARPEFLQPKSLCIPYVFSPIRRAERAGIFIHQNALFPLCFRHSGARSAPGNFLRKKALFPLCFCNSGARSAPGKLRNNAFSVRNPSRQKLTDKRKYISWMKNIFLKDSFRKDSFITHLPGHAW